MQNEIAEIKNEIDEYFLHFYSDKWSKMVVF